MNKLTYCALAVIAMTACTKQIHPTPPTTSDEIRFATKAYPTKGLVPDYKTNLNNFFTGDQIGVYMAASGVAIDGTYTFGKTTLDAADAKNYGYTFGTPYWIPLDAAAAKLKYQKNSNVQLFAYFPFKSTSVVPNNPLTLPTTTTPAEFSYALPLNQTSDIVIRMTDLMWSSATNTNAGYEMQSTPINLEFMHKLAKVNFLVKVYNTSATTDVTPYLRAVVVNGGEINTDQTAKFNVVTGDLTPAPITDAAHVGEVFYFNGTTTGLFTGSIPKNTAKANAVELKYENTGVEPNVTTKNIDLLLYPFTQTVSKNRFYFYFTKDATKTYATMAALRAAIATDEVEEYSWDMPVAVAGISNDFAAGNNNTYSVVIDVATKAINLTTTIKAWNEMAVQDITAE